MTGEKYARVASTSEIPAGEKKCVTIEGQEILLCHTAEGFFAIDAICSHAFARLDEGRMRGHRILCPRHGAAFDVRDGRALSQPAMTGVRSHPVRVEGDQVLVSIRGQS